MGRTPPVESRLCFLDTETTGLTPGKDEVSEIAAIMTDFDLNEKGRIEMKVKLSSHDAMSAAAAKVNGYDPGLWDAEAKPFSEFQDWLKKMCKYPNVAIPVGHNVQFDYDMIVKGYYSNPKKFCQLAYRKINTVGIAMQMRIAGVISVNDFKLDTVRKALGIGGDVHRAMGDVEAMMRVFEIGIDLMKTGLASSHLDPGEVAQEAPKLKPAPIQAPAPPTEPAKEPEKEESWL